MPLVLLVNAAKNFSSYFLSRPPAWERCTYYEGRLDAIVEKVKRLASSRTLTVAGAFSDLRKEAYSKAIVMLLITADGRCLEITGYSFFMRDRTKRPDRRRRPEISHYVDQYRGDSLRYATLEPLKQILPLNKNGTERIPEETAQLNRHALCTA